MENNAVEMKSIEMYDSAVEIIKTAIFQAQYEAVKEINRIQLALYFAIGKFLSANTCKGGEGALSGISNQLRKKLPGLRGFSATQLKEIRLFYEECLILIRRSQPTN